MRSGRPQTTRDFYKLCTPLRRNAAGGLLRDRRGRLNYRVISALSVIGTEPGHSNLEIAERVGIDAKGHASALLARMAGFGLIENAVVDPASCEASAWQLTASGMELETAIPDYGRATAARTSRSAHPPAMTKENR